MYKGYTEFGTNSSIVNNIQLVNQSYIVNYSIVNNIQLVNQSYIVN